MITVAFYDTKPYNREYFNRVVCQEKVRCVFHDFRLSSATVESAAGADAVCVFVNDRLNATCLEGLRRAGVKLVTLRCAGFNNVDIAAAQRLGMAVTRVPAYSPHAVAEHTVALLLSLNRKIHRAYNRVREHNFSLSGLVGFDLHGKTIGLVGTGRIGKIAAKIFRGFGMEVLAYDPFPSIEWAAEAGVRYVGFEPLLSNSHIVSLHLPLTSNTHHLLKADTLSLMKHGSILVNTSRGGLIDTPAMIEAVKNGGLGGVALDVYEEEEGIFFEDHSADLLLDENLSRLLSFPNVLITSHQAFLTDEAMSEIARVTYANLLCLDGRLPFIGESVLAGRE